MASRRAKRPKNNDDCDKVIVQALRADVPSQSNKKMTFAPGEKGITTLPTTSSYISNASMSASVLGKLYRELNGKNSYLHCSFVIHNFSPLVGQRNDCKPAPGDAKEGHT